MKTIWTDCLNLIENAARIAVFTHKSADGDAVGSAYALAAALSRGGKAVCVFTGELYPENLQFVVYGKGVETIMLSGDNPPLENYTGDNSFDLGIAVDCATAERIAASCLPVFEACKKTIRIDHHLPCEGSDFADINIADPAWAAACEGLWDFLKVYCDGVRCEKPDCEIAIRLYTGILTDTGRFVYTCTTGNTFRTVGELVDITGTDLNHIARSLFDVKKPAVTRLIATAYNKTRLLFGGKVAYVYLSNKDFEEAGALDSDANNIPPILINIEGVELAVFARQLSDGSCGSKVSMRCSTRYNVASLCNIFGGGGHACASGCTIKEAPETVQSLVLKEIEKII